MTGIFTIDSILALMVLLTMVTASVYLISEPTIPRDEYLYQLSIDVLTIAEDGDYLDKAINNDHSGIDLIKRSLPSNICFELRLKNSTDDLTLSSSTGCGTPKKYVIGKRSIIADNKFYIADLKVWYK